MYRPNLAPGDAAGLLRLLDWGSATAHGDVSALPTPVVAKALTVICDDIAAMVAAAGEKEVRAVNKLAGNHGANRGATLIGRPGVRVKPEWAAMANATAANWLELDGGYRLATCHGSLYTLPAAMAELEANGGTVGDLVVAVVTAYEIVTRVARAYRPPLPLTAHPHATLSPLGAGAAVAASRSLGSEAFASTVLSAATFSLNGPFSHAGQGATVRNAWAGAGAHLGFLAADLVKAGLSSSRTAVHDVFNTSYGYPEDEAFLTANLGERYAIEDGYHKLYACCQYLHSSVEAALHLAGAALKNVPTRDIADIEVRTHALACALDSVEPSTVLGGKFSLPHTVSTVLHLGSAEAVVFSEANLNDPIIRALRAKVRITEWTQPLEPPNDRPSSIIVRLKDGSVFESTVLSAIGGADRPLSLDELLVKIGSMTGERHPAFAEVVREFIHPESETLNLPVREFIPRLLKGGAQ